MKGFVSPSAVDPRVRGWTASHHHVAPDQVVPQGVLVLVFPGTAANPKDYRRLADQAGALGMHCLVLGYPNDVSINELAGDDPFVHLALRMDNYDGSNRTGRVTLEPGECVEERLVAVLSWLAANRPAEGWGDYLTENGVVWAKVAAFGHSLGGGYAALLAREHRLDRCVAFGWADWCRGTGALADWVADASGWATPPERRFWVGHERDEMVPAEIGQKMAANFASGSRSARVESEDPPYGWARILWTDLDPAGEWPTGQPRHNSLALDVETPKWPDGSCVLADLWTWLLVGRAR